MTIQLTTAFQLPAMHGQPAATYNEVKILVVGINLWEKEIALTVQYGNTNADGDWQPGLVDTTVHVIRNVEVVVDADGNEVQPADPEYDLFMASTFPKNMNDPSFDQDAEALYQHLIDEGMYTGTINS